MTHSQSDLEDRANRITEAIVSIQKSIELLESSQSQRISRSG